MKCKAKLDGFTHKGYLIEIKTVSKLEVLERQMDTYRYDLQLSFYKEALIRSALCS